MRGRTQLLVGVGVAGVAWWLVSRSRDGGAAEMGTNASLPFLPVCCNSELRVNAASGCDEDCIL